MKLDHCLFASLVTMVSVVAPAAAESEALDRPKASLLRPNILLCIADDWSWPHAGACGDAVVRTPTFDSLARMGVLFRHAYCAAPSCTPSRAAILTGRPPHALEAGGNLWGYLPAKFPVYPDLLEAAGYAVGHSGKGWGPGDFQPGGRPRNPAGPRFNSLAQFLETVPPGKPFCFWFGSTDPHRPYEPGSGLKAGHLLSDVTVPPFLPDTPEVRGDMLDYYAEVERFDRQVGELLALLKRKGLEPNTIVVMTSDNGMPFPRCKANLYEYGVHIPLAIRWPARFQGRRTVDALVSLADLAPTFLEAAGLPTPTEMTARSLLPLLQGAASPGRDAVFFERERHANVRAGDLGFPARAVRTSDFLYIRNYCPDRWPAGDPVRWKAVGEFGDCDNGPSKSCMLANRAAESGARLFELAFGKRPAEELYDLAKDPFQLNNVAEDPRFASPRRRLAARLQHWMEQTQDPRATGGGAEFDAYPYYGEGPARPPQPRVRATSR
jgi:arylsulfatase A-like enzyme